jgi:VanZ family protein
MKVQGLIELDASATGMPRRPNPYQLVPGNIKLVRRDAGDRLKVRRWLPPLLWAGVILFGTSLPQAAVPLQTSGIDKILHFTIYTVFAYLLSRQIAEDTTPSRAALGAVVIAVAFAAADEWHQRFIPGRSTEFADWLADCAGAFVGALAFVAIHRMRRTKEPAGG